MSIVASLPANGIKEVVELGNGGFATLGDTVRLWAADGPDGPDGFKFRDLSLAHAGIPEPPKRVPSCAARLQTAVAELLLVGTTDGSVVAFADGELVSDMRIGARVDAVCPLSGLEVVIAAGAKLQRRTYRAPAVGGPPWAQALLAGSPGTTVPPPETLAVDGAVVYARFQGTDGVVGTSANSLWYVSWSTSSTVCLSTFHSAPCRLMSWSPQILATGADDGVRLWRNRSGLVTFACGQRVLSLCVVGRLVCAGYADGFMRLFDHAKLAAVGKAPHRAG